MALVREGAAVPHVGLAQCTDGIDWSEVELRVYGARPSAEGLFCLPEDGDLVSLHLGREGEGFALREDPLAGKVNWSVRAFP